MVNRPLEDLRPFGPFFDLEDAEPVAEIRQGPIWTWVEVTTFEGSREESETVTIDHVEFVDNEIRNLFLSEPVKERLEFAGEINDFDITCRKSSELTVSCFIRHTEDFISIPLLHDIVEPLQDRINVHQDLQVRDYRVVTTEFVEDRLDI